MELRKDETLELEGGGHMATTTPDTEPTDMNTERRATDKPSDVAKRWIFPVLLLVAVIVTWNVLFATGMASGAFGVVTYPLTLTTIVMVFHIIILVFPVVLIIRKKAWLRLIPVAIMVFGPLVLLVVGYVLIAGIPLWGLIFPGVLALILSAAAAYILTRFPAEDQTLIQEVNSLPDLNESIAQQQRKEEASRVQFQAAKDESDRLQAESSDAVSLAEKSSKAYTKAKKDFDEHDLVKEQSGIAKDLATKKAALEAIPDQQQAILNSIAQANGKDVRPLESKYQQLGAKYEPLKKEVADLERKLEESNRKVEALDEKRVLDEATAKNKTDSEAEQSVRRKLKAANKRMEKLTGLWNHEQAATATLVKQRDEVSAKQQSANETKRLLWRDDLFVPIVLAVVALLCYPAWYGWVATQVF